MKKYGLLSALLIFTSACGDGFETKQQASNETDKIVEDPLVTYLETNVLDNLVFGFVGDPYTTITRHHSGDQIFFSRRGAGTVNASLYFQVKGAEYETASIAMYSLRTGGEVQSGQCGFLGVIGTPPVCSLTLESKLLQFANCPGLISPVQVLQPIPGNYDIRVTLADGTIRHSVVRFPDSCDLSVAGHSERAEEKSERKIASVTEDLKSQKLGWYWGSFLLGILFLFLLLFVRAQLRRTK